jgi:hypothetical protein
VEVQGRVDEHSEAVLDTALRSPWAQDLPVCFPGRSCVDVPPAGAGVITLTTALTPASGVVAASCWAALGVSLVVIGLGLRLQWRGFGARPWTVVLSVALLLGGVVTAWAIGGRLAELATVYGGADGRPPALTPSALTGSWPLVESAGSAGAALGAVALFLMLNTAAIRERRAGRSREIGRG